MLKKFEYTQNKLCVSRWTRHESRNVQITVTNTRISKILLKSVDYRINFDSDFFSSGK